MIANSEGQNILHMAAIYRRKEAFFEGLRKKQITNSLINMVTLLFIILVEQENYR